MQGYCAVASAHPLHQQYHDHEYGFPVRDDAGLFERLVLEINQAGLSWLTVLKKRAALRQAFDHFDLDRVAQYDAADVERLMADAGIIRHRLKIAAVIENAQRLIVIRKQYGSFAGWLDAHHPLDRAAWTKLFKRTFLFTGGEIVNEFLQSTGYLAGAHDPACPIYQHVLALDPPWHRSVGASSAD